MIKTWIQWIFESSESKEPSPRTQQFSGIHVGIDEPRRTNRIDNEILTTTHGVHWTLSPPNHVIRFQ